VIEFGLPLLPVALVEVWLLLIPVFGVLVPLVVPVLDEPTPAPVEEVPVALGLWVAVPAPVELGLELPVVSLGVVPAVPVAPLELAPGLLLWDGWEVVVLFCDGDVDVCELPLVDELPGMVLV
jgi:hypothetical protein